MLNKARERLGANLRRARESRGFESASALAREMSSRRSKIPRQTLENIESGLRAPSVEMLMRICRDLEYTADELLDGVYELI